MAITILYEDDQLLALSKPAGQLTIPGRGPVPEEPALAEAESHTGAKVFVIHRLDRGASGVLLLAKDAASHRALCLQFELRQVQKTYRVLVQGIVESGGQIDKPLHLFGSGRMGVHPKGKPSMTEFSVLEPLRQATLLEVMPRTGRRHQIRVHFYAIGHPVIGDALYGKERPVGGASRLMLHALSLEFLHPNGQKLALRSDPPEDFEAILKLFRG